MALLALDTLFFAATASKLLDGGWYPLLIAFVISFLMLTWRKGEQIMDEVRLEIREKTETFLDNLRKKPPIRMPGTAVVLGRMATGVPLALSHNLKCSQVLHESVYLVAVSTAEVPYAPEEERAVVQSMAEGITRVELRFGFMEEPNIPQELEAAMQRGQIPLFDLSKTIYYTGHETIIPAGLRAGLPRWREAIFAFMHHNAQRPGAYFKIPSSQIMEIGVEFDI
jgi:KUP system potassium uptake protein